MIINILNQPGSKVDELSSYKLLRIAVLFGKIVFYCNSYNYYIRAEEDLRSITNLVSKLDLLKFFMPLFYKTDRGLVPFIDQVLYVIKSYQSIKNKHNIPPSLISGYMQSRDVVDKLEKKFISCCEGFLNDENLKALQEFDRQDKHKVMLLWLPKDIDVDFSRKDFKQQDYMMRDIAEYRFLYGIIKDRSEFAMFGSTFMETSLYQKGFNLEKFEGELIISPEPLFALPLLDKLNVEQIKIIRQNFLSAFSDMLYFFENFYTTENPSVKCSGRLGEREKLLIGNLLEKSSCFQKAVDENMYIKYLRSANADNTESRIHLGICSMNTLIKLYRELGLIYPEMELYMRDHVFKDVDLKQPCPSLFVI